MAQTLRDNLTSSYFNAANRLYSKKARRRIVAYVESYDDVPFWRTLFEEFENDECYFGEREEDGIDEYIKYG